MERDPLSSICCCRSSGWISSSSRRRAPEALGLGSGLMCCCFFCCSSAALQLLSSNRKASMRCMRIVCTAPLTDRIRPTLVPHTLREFLASLTHRLFVFCKGELARIRLCDGLAYIIEPRLVVSRDAVLHGDLPRKSRRLRRRRQDPSDPEERTRAPQHRHGLGLLHPSSACLSSYFCEFLRVLRREGSLHLCLTSCIEYSS